MEDSVLSSLLRVNRHRMQDLRRTLAPYRYVGVMHLIILYTARNPGTSQEEIAGFYAVDKASVARDARRLEDMGHIRRAPDPEDRRQYQLELTEAGRAMLPVLRESYEVFQRRLSAGLSQEEWSRLAALLKRLEENACGG